MHGEAEGDAGGHQRAQPAGEGAVGQGTEAHRRLVAAIQAEHVRAPQEPALAEPVAQRAQIRGRGLAVGSDNLLAPRRIGALPQEV